jgi:hypothetical protein
VQISPAFIAKPALTNNIEHCGYVSLSVIISGTNFAPPIIPKALSKSGNASRLSIMARVWSGTKRKPNTLFKSVQFLYSFCSVLPSVFEAAPLIINKNLYRKNSVESNNPFLIRDSENNRQMIGSWCGNKWYPLQLLLL